MFLEMVLWRGYFRSPTVLALVNVLAGNNNAVFLCFEGYQRSINFSGM